jgi:hypothetical protein
MEIESSDPNQTKYVEKSNSLRCSLGRTASIAQTVEGLIGSDMFATPTILEFVERLCSKELTQREGKICRLSELLGFFLGGH